MPELWRFDGRQLTVRVLAQGGEEVGVAPGAGAVAPQESEADWEAEAERNLARPA